MVVERVRLAVGGGAGMSKRTDRGRELTKGP